MTLLSLLALLQVAAAQTTDALLPPTPADWRYERMDFPLGFAPDLDYTGFEELRFAPGMYEPDSASYFSYAFAIRLEQDLSVDVDFVRGFLDGYYRGLCTAVAESRDLELDLDAIYTQVSFDGVRYVASIEMFDAFVTGEPLDLRVEVAVQAGARTTELLGLASPLGRDEDIWKTLDALHEDWLAARPVPAFLNHLYVVPDAQTYAALEQSEFLAGFGVRETRTTVRTDLTYTGLYFYGQTTYFEFLSPSEAFPAWSTGLAFGFERAAASSAAARVLGERGIGAQVTPITRAFREDQVPWFQMLDIASAADSPLSLFALEYDARFLERWHPEHAPRTGGIARSSVLERYAAQLGQTDRRSSAALLDIQAVQLALAPAAVEHLIAVCEGLGYEARRGEDEVVLDGPGVMLVVRPAGESRGVTGLELTCREPIERDPIELGRARLSFHGTTARLEFQPAAVEDPGRR